MKTKLFCIALAYTCFIQVGVSAESTTGTTVADGPIDIGSRLELFVDDFLVENIAGKVGLHLHHPEPQEIVLVTDKPWEGNTCCYYNPHNIFTGNRGNNGKTSKIIISIISFGSNRNLMSSTSSSFNC